MATSDPELALSAATAWAERVADDSAAELERHLMLNSDCVSEYLAGAPIHVLCAFARMGAVAAIFRNRLPD